jgi:cyclase
MIPRIIPVLLIADGGLVKTVKFREPRYIGDPINAVRIFNDKQVDELLILDIQATAEGRGPDEASIADIVSEAFMPVGYGGGVQDLATATRLIQLGVEKIIINSAMVEYPNRVAEIADRLGSSTVVASIDASARGSGRHEIFVRGGTKATGIDIRAHAEKAVALGAGEIIVNSIDRDGTMNGFDLELIRSVTSVVDVPVVACGGASGLPDLVAAIRDGGASAAAAGSMFVYHGRHRAVLITYPSYQARAELFSAGVQPHE